MRLMLVEFIQLVVLFRFPGIWNTNLLNELNDNKTLTLNGTITYEGLEQGLDIFVGVIIILLIVEIGKEVYSYYRNHIPM